MGKVRLLKLSGASLCCLSLVLLSACDKSDKGGETAKAEVKAVKVELSPQLKEGESIWMQNCKVCHEPGLAHAPKIKDKNEWEKRLAKGMDKLITNALEGINEMPPRGANASLNDTQVSLAVKYMVEVSQQ